MGWILPSGSRFQEPHFTSELTLLLGNVPIVGSIRTYSIVFYYELIEPSHIECNKKGIRLTFCLKSLKE